jgi:uncharacterized membrane protein
MKYIITESQYNKAIDRFISYQFEPHEENTSKKYPDSIFWTKNGRIIVEIENSEYFWVINEIWTNISSMFSLEYEETQEVIKYWLEEHYNLGSLTPTYSQTYTPVQLEEHYNYEIYNNRK